MVAADGKRRDHACEKSTEENQAQSKSHNDAIYVNRFDAAHVLPRCDEPLNYGVRKHHASGAANR